MVTEHRFTERKTGSRFARGIDIVAVLTLVCHWFPVMDLGSAIVGAMLALVCYLIVLMVKMFMRLTPTNS